MEVRPDCVKNRFTLVLVEWVGYDFLFGGVLDVLSRIFEMAVLRGKCEQ